MLFVSFLAAALTAAADVQVIDGVTVECKDGVCRIVDLPETPAPPARATGDAPSAAAPRLAQGYLAPDDFLAFLRGDTRGGAFAGKTIGVILVLVLLGGLAMNLTPCVLPMMPVNLMIVGRSATRGFWYGAGIAVAYGFLGVCAAVGSMAFGEIQGNAWFNAAVSLVFLVLSLSLFDVFFIDLSRWRRTGTATAPDRRGAVAGAVFAFFMGALSAILAGACVAPVLISVLVLTADLFAKGQTLALALPFVLGLGMALPWPFVGAGLRVLPRPGAWMTRVNRLFAVVVLGFSLWYGFLAVTALRADALPPVETAGNAAVVNVTPEGFAAALARAKRPVLVDCWAGWCKNCTAMEKQTFREKRVADALKGFTIIRLRAEDIRALRALPGFESVKGLPAYAIYP
jgi:thiol:disulfide interchange protein